MGTIEKRQGKDGKAHYRAKVRLKGHPHESKTFSRRTDAKRWVRSIEAAIDEGRRTTHSEAQRRTLAQLLDKYEAQVLPEKRSQQTQRQMLSWWRDELGDQKLVYITPAVIADHRDKLLHGYTSPGSKRSPSTVVRYMAIISHAFTLAVKEWGWVDENPVLKVTKPKEPRGRDRYLTSDERDALLKACRTSPNPYLYTVVLLAISTGMRRGEIMTLRWNDIDLKGDAITVRETKNDEIRRVPLVGPAKQAVTHLAKVRQINTNLLFPSAKRADTPVDLRHPWEQALEYSGVQDFRFHDLRHTAASYLAMNGASLLELSRILGHKSLEMVKRYAHLSDPHLHDVVKSMADQFLADA